MRKRLKKKKLKDAMSKLFMSTITIAQTPGLIFKSTKNLRLLWRDEPDYIF